MTWEIQISGRVQGVGYRWFAARTAALYGITGCVRNLQHGTVQVIACGPPEILEAFVGELRKGPRFAEVVEVKITTLKEVTEYYDFKITD